MLVVTPSMGSTLFGANSNIYLQGMAERAFGDVLSIETQGNWDMLIPVSTSQPNHWYINPMTQVPVHHTI